MRAKVVRSAVVGLADAAVAGLLPIESFGAVLGHTVSSLDGSSLA